MCQLKFFNMIYVHGCLSHFVRKSEFIYFKYIKVNVSIIAIFIFTSFYRSICKLSINFNSNFEMAEEYTTLNEEKLTQLIRKIFQEEFKKQEVHITNIISSNFKITMEEIKKLQE